MSFSSTALQQDQSQLLSSGGKTEQEAAGAAGALDSNGKPVGEDDTAQQ